ncbi:MAG: tetratricopeptide repeat protein [Candidatus Marinimicrobia bacterium]|nr:tetratricopeptide repeat protein [Candidatus Neomarinimicrobiota bacterium]
MKNLSLPIFLIGIFSIAALSIACDSTEMTSAKVYLQQNNLEKAEEQVLLSISAEPSNPLPSYWLGYNIYAKQKRWEEMNAMFDKSLSISPKFESEINFERESQWVKKFNEGATTFNNVLNGTATDVDAVVAKAIMAFETAILILPTKSQAYSSLASIYLRDKNTEMAKEYLIKTLEYEMDNVNALVNLGLLYSNSEDFDIANDHFNKALELEPGNLIALQQLAQNFDIAGKSADAEEMYQKAMAADPDNSNLMYNLGVIYLKADNFEKAEEMFISSLALTPDDCDAVANIAVVYSNMNDRLEDAENYLLKSIDCAPTENIYWRKLVGIYMKMGKPKDAQKALDKAKELGYKP